MKKLTILVDMDDVLENLCEAWIKYLNIHNGTKVKMSDITDWDITKAFPHISREEVFAPLFKPDFWETVRPKEGAIEYVGRLIDDGHKVIVVTASHPDTVSCKLNQVLFRYFPCFTYKDVIIASQKALIKGDILIDDAPHNLIDFDGIGILMSANHNIGFDVKGHKIIRKCDWKSIYDDICFIAKGGI